MKHYDIFCCYARKDYRKVKRFCDRLEIEKITIFGIECDLSEQNFAESIISAIKDCRLFLYFHSIDAAQSNWIYKEISFAINYGCKILAINISGLYSDDTNIRLKLYDRQWIDFDDVAYNSEEQFEKIIYRIIRLGQFESVSYPYDNGGSSQIPPYVMHGKSYDFYRQQNNKDKLQKKTYYIKYRCFIGGSTSVINERNAVRATLSILYNQYEKYDFFITSHTFEDFRNKYTVEGQQYQYDEFIKKRADCTIFIICQKIGQKTLDEYNLAVKTYKLTGQKRPAIFVYNDVSENSINNQDISVERFKKLVDKNKAYWRDYNSLELLMQMVKEDISAELADLLEMQPNLQRSDK